VGLTFELMVCKAGALLLELYLQSILVSILVWLFKFFLVILGFDLRASHLLGRCSTT
jgi:hypothetical protein